MNRRIVVDGDSCPVRTEIISTAQEFSVPVIFVATFAHFMGKLDYAEIIYVDSFNQSSDLYIANYIKQGDVLITGDYGLASMVLREGISILSFKGVEITKENIDIFLSQRHYSAKMRRGGKKVKGPKPFTDNDKKKFVENLRKILKS